MLCQKTLPYLHRPLSPLRSLFSSSPRPLFPSPPPFISLSSSSAASRRLRPLLALPSAALSSMASSLSADATTTSTVEHVVLFQVKPGTDPSAVDAMLTNLRSLVSLDGVSHLTAAPILRHRSSAGAAFTHLLHSRYPSKTDLSNYSGHPSHVAVVKENVLPICEDIMAVDWVADLDSSAPVAVRPGSAARLTFVKLKEGAGEGEKAEVLSVLGGIKRSVPDAKIEQVSFGENFSPARAKGYSIALLTVFPGVEELDALDAAVEAVEAQKEKVRPLMESVIVVDFVVPAPPSASL